MAKHELVRYQKPISTYEDTVDGQKVKVKRYEDSYKPLEYFIINSKKLHKGENL